MSLELQGYVELPEHRQSGGFDHAAVHDATLRLLLYPWSMCGKGQ